MQPRTVINKNTGPQTKYRKVQDSYKNTGIYRTAGISKTKLNVGAQLKTFPYPILINDPAESSPKSL